MTNSEQQNLRVVCSNERVLLQQTCEESRHLAEKLNKLVRDPPLVQLQRLVQLVNAEYGGIVEPSLNRRLHSVHDWLQFQQNLFEN